MSNNDIEAAKDPLFVSVFFVCVALRGSFDHLIVWKPKLFLFYWCQQIMNIFCFFNSWSLTLHASGVKVRKKTTFFSPLCLFFEWWFLHNVKKSSKFHIFDKSISTGERKRFSFESGVDYLNKKRITGDDFFSLWFCVWMKKTKFRQKAANTSHIFSSKKEIRQEKIEALFSKKKSVMLKHRVCCLFKIPGQRRRKKFVELIAHLVNLEEKRTWDTPRFRYHIHTLLPCYFKHHLGEEPEE